MNPPTCCHGCAKDIVGDYITCQGFCYATFHPAVGCCGSLPAALTSAAEHSQLLWVCRSCKTLMADMRVRRNVKVAYDSGLDAALGHHKEIVRQLKTEIVMELKKELQLNFASLINSSSHTPASGRGGLGAKRDKAKGRRLFGNKSNFALLDPETTATGDDASPSFGSLVATQQNQNQEREREPKFWLYLSRADPSVTVDTVTKLACKRLHTTDVEVYRLVAKGKDVRRMSFISFKIGLPVQLKEKALKLSTWPAGLLVREFEDRPNRNFWQPDADVESEQNTPTGSELNSPAESNQNTPTIPRPPAPLIMEL